MKKNVFILLINVAIVSIAVFTLVSCSKSNMGDVEHKKVQTLFSPSGEDVEPLITRFLERFENYKTGLKTSGEDMTLGEAIWTIEAATNYEFRGFKENVNNEVSYDSLLIAVPISLGSDNDYYISETDVMETFDSFLNYTENTVSKEYEVLLVADVSSVEFNNDDVVMRLLTVKSGIGLDPCSTTATDYWFPTQGMGKCGSYVGQNQGKDATDIIDRIINCSQVEADYWTDIEVFELIYNGFYNCDEDEIFWEGDYEDCLSPTDVSDYSDLAICLINQLKPEGKSRIRADLEWDVITNPVIVYNHFLNYVSFGVPHNSGGGTK